MLRDLDTHYTQNLLIKTLLLWLTMTTIHAQSLQTSQAFASATPFLEPDGRRLSIKLPDENFITLAKAKGGIGGPTEYALEKYHRSLKKHFQTSLHFSESEEVKQLFYNGTDLIVFSFLPEEEKKSCTLLAKILDVNTGETKAEKKLCETKIGKWLPAVSKGAVKQTIEGLASIVTGQGFAAPLQYRYEITYSPDSSKVLAYIFDYSQPLLYATACIFDKDLNKIVEGNIPIDNTFINYGLYVNNAGEVVILNGDRLGSIVVVEYDLATHHNRILDIPYASAHRESLHLQILNNDIVYVANIVASSKGKLMAVMHSKFNFQEHKVEHVNYHHIDEALEEKVRKYRSEAKAHGDESWHHFEISHFEVDKDGNVTMALEKREIQSAEFSYDPGSINDPEKWHEGIAKVCAESILIFRFDKEGKPILETYHPKLQTAEISSGLNILSFNIHVSPTGKLRLIYTTSDNASGIYNTIHYLEYNNADPAANKEIKLANPDGIGLLRPYTLWWEDGLVLAGKKGLLGKKSYLCAYKLE